jgi:2-dehydro-3-deoxyphosphooctonate aldolase (KDO 8-P synthase)
MKNSVRKLESYGNDNIILTDRGTFFGYNTLVNDMTSLPIMSKTGYPVCFDATHSVQMPTSMGNISGGQREFIPYLVRAAVACGINLLFMEVHDDPKNAKSDSNTVLDIKYLKKILISAKEFHLKRLELEKKLGAQDVK